MLIRRYVYLAVALLVGALLVAQGANAQGEPDVIATVRQAVADGETAGGIDTILVFTNLRRTTEKISMTAVDEGGNRVGGGDLELAGHGISAVLLSRIVDDSSSRRFVGKVLAKATGNVAGTALLVGAGPLTDLPVLRSLARSRLADAANEPGRLIRITHLTFPVAAAN